MSQVFPQPQSDLPDPVTSTYLEDSLFENIVTEDDEPVDNLFSAKQQRLLVESLYSSWAGPADGTRFMAEANVGVFHSLKAPPLVPDMFLSLKAQVPDDCWQKRHRSYFISEFGKPPEVVIEIVSNQEGEEDGRKLLDYARMGVHYYVIFDPFEELKAGMLRVYELQEGAYIKQKTRWLAEVELGVALWTGTFEGIRDVWLRWCDKEGNLIPTGKELAEIAKERARQAKERARQAQQVAQLTRQAQQAELALAQERLQTERLMAQLRALGVTPLPEGTVETKFLPET